MRGLALLLMLFAVCTARAADVNWFHPAEPGKVPVLVQLGVEHAAALRRTDALRARGHASVNWRDARYSPQGLSRLLAAGHSIDRSRVALLAKGDDVAPALALLDGNDATRTDLRGMILYIDSAASRPILPKPARWPALMLIYDADRAAARDSAFDLARRARAQGAAVWLHPAARTDVGNDAAVMSWLSALEIRRTGRFEDATVMAYRGARHDAQVQALNRHAQTMFGAAPSEAPGDARTHPSQWTLDAEGRIVQLRPGAAVAEFDARAALRAVLGDEELQLHLGPAAPLALAHPETGARVHALPTLVVTRDGPRSMLMLRHAEGSYAYLDLQDRREVVALAASKDARDRGRAWWALMDEADARGSRLLRITLPAGLPRRGLWWDPSHPGHALDLQSIPGGHSVVFATFDDRGDSRWYLASGRITRDVFAAGNEGLQLMRRNPALAVPRPDPNHAARIVVDFSIDVRHPACAQRKAEALQLALLTVSDARRTLNWCIEPVALPEGLPEADVNGTWYGGVNDSGWGLTVIASGAAESRLVSAMLYYHDAQGWPRWAMGASRAGDTGAVLSMHAYALACVACANAKLLARPIGDMRLRHSGWCGQPELRAAFDLTADAELRFQRDESALDHVTEPRCH
jgi:hypothetical protein